MSIPIHFIEEKEKELIFDLQNLAIDKYGSIRKLARKCSMNRKIMDRIQAHGVYSLTTFSALKLCLALDITPNQLYGFEPLPKLDQKSPLQKTSYCIKQLSYREIHARLNDRLFTKGG